MKTKILLVCLLVATVALASCGQSTVLLVGTSPDYPPFESLDGDGQLIGFDMDLMAAIAEDINAEIEYKELDFTVIISSVQSDQIDIGLSGFTWSEEREGKVLFSTPYYNSAQVAVVKADSGITTLDGLKGMKLLAGEGTTGMAAAKEIEGADVVSPDDYSLAFEMLKGGQADAVICDIGVAKSYCESSDFVMLDAYLNDAEEMCIILKNENTELLDEINESIAAFVLTDEYQDLLAKWGLK